MGGFFKAEVGKLCNNPVNNRRQCKKAADHFPNALYSTLKGAGHHLPGGCVWDNVAEDEKFVYWNPDGSVLSNDPNIRQVCYSADL